MAKKFFAGGLFLAVGALAFVILHSSSAKVEQTESFSSTSLVGPAAFIEEVRHLKGFVENDLKAINCETTIAGYTEALYALPTQYFMPKDEDQTSLLKAEGLRTLQDLFEIRLALRKALKNFESVGPVPAGCLTMIRRAFRVSRFTEEFLLEWLQAKNVLQTKSYGLFQGGFPQVLFNSEFQNEDRNYQAGDLILEYGRSQISATISQVGDEPSSFSHLAMIGENSKGELFIVQARIETGTEIVPLKEWEKTEVATKAVLFRFEDSKAATLAAQIIYEKAHTYNLKHHENIHYDFAMNETDHSTLFCPEVIEVAYEMATQKLYGKALVYPKYRTQIERLKGKGYLEAMGIKSKDLIAPADVEMDTRFHLIQEYRNPEALRFMRLQEAILRSVFKWIEDKDYRFHFSPFYKLESYLGLAARQFGLLKSQMPSYMPRPALEMVLQITAVAKVLNEKVLPWEEEYFKVHGNSVAYKEIMDQIEVLRKDDCTKARQFHSYFSSNKGCG